MRERVPSSAIVGVARLERYRLTWDKPGADGSGKANIAPCPESVVWGVVYGLEPGEWLRLDACEPGYARTSIEVTLADEIVSCVTYRASGTSATALPFEWYRSLVIEGARHHGLPETYVRGLETIPIQPDDRD